jgi:hypothetical protein
MAENNCNDRGPVSRGGIAPQPLFAVGRSAAWLVSGQFRQPPDVGRVA